MKTLNIRTTLKCTPHTITRMRKMIIAQAIDILGSEDDLHTLFHNHVGGIEVHRNPVIQYRCIKGNLEIFALGEGVDAISRVIITADPDNRDHHIHINNVTMKKANARIRQSERMEYYRLYDWIAMNSKTYKEDWKQCYTLVERASILTKCITGHLRILGHQLDQRDQFEGMQGELMMITGSKVQTAYGQSMLGLNVIFRTPYHLPEHYALGRCTSIGAGTFQKLSTHPEDKVDKKDLRSDAKSKAASNSKLEKIIKE